jgi:hypothetical protein
LRQANAGFAALSAVAENRIQAGEADGHSRQGR